METNDKMPNINRDYPESDVSDNQRQTEDPEKADLKDNKKRDEAKGTGGDVENLPEIKPARTGILG